MQLTIYYSVQNGGDGSAYPTFCESKLVADIHQELLVNGYEGWGEPCTGSITVEGESIKVLDTIYTATDLKEELEEVLNDNWMNLNENEVKKAIKKLGEK